MNSNAEFGLSVGVAGKQHLPILDFLKGFSISTIVLFHLISDYLSFLPTIIKKASLLGGTGVHVFFLCSGIGLGLSFFAKQTTYLSFIKRRFLKIYLPYILVVLVSFCIPFIYIYEDRLYALLSHIFLYKMFIEKYEGSFGGQLWFVSTIIQLYILFIPMCLLKRKINNDLYFFTLFLSISAIWWLTCTYLEVNFH